MDDLLLLPLWYAVFLLSLTVHEAAHAWAALRGGDATALDQVTLNPLPHVRRERLGTVVVPLISFLMGGWMMGWASTPFDPVWAERHPRRVAWMALAGPAANLSLVLLSAALMRVGMARGFFVPPSSVDASHVVGVVEPSLSWLATSLSIVFTLNLLLFVLNMLPVPPLDGASALELLLGARLSERWRALRQQPALALFGLLAVWNVFHVVFRPVQTAALNLLFFGRASYG